MTRNIIMLTKFCLFALFITGCISQAYSLTELNRTKRANNGQFLNAHVISQKTYNALSKSPTPDKHWDNLMQGITRKGQRVPGGTPNNYHERPKHTFIVGNRKEVNKAAAGTQLQSTGRWNNLYGSNKAFQQVEVHRFGNGKGPIKNIYDMGRTPFNSGVDAKKRPVHYQPGGGLGIGGFGNNRGNNAPRGNSLFSAAPKPNNRKPNRRWGG